MDVELVANPRATTGEGPLWHPDEAALFWLDIPNGRLYRYDPATGENEVAHADERRIGGLTLQADGDLLLFGDAGVIQAWSPEDGLGETVRAEIPEERGSRFNDVIAGPAGRVYAGTMAEGGSRGRLYRLERDGTLDVLIEGVATANGMGFSPDANRFYFTETNTETVWSFDVDRDTGDLRNRREFASTVGHTGKPDGLAVDAEGGVWSARWNGNCVVRYAPDGSVDRRVRVPARKVASLTFGGAALDTAYATTATGGYDPASEGDGAGGLFAFDPGVEGRPAYRSRIDL